MRNTTLWKSVFVASVAGAILVSMSTEVRQSTNIFFTGFVGTRTVESAKEARKHFDEQWAHRVVNARFATPYDVVPDEPEEERVYHRAQELAKKR